MPENQVLLTVKEGAKELASPAIFTIAGIPRDAESSPMPEELTVKLIGVQAENGKVVLKMECKETGDVLTVGTPIDAGTILDDSELIGLTFKLVRASKEDGKITLTLKGETGDIITVDIPASAQTPEDVKEATVTIEESM